MRSSIHWQLPVCSKMPLEQNVPISGAETECQAEIGTACSIAAAGLAHLLILSLKQIEYYAEVAMGHFLSLTCDPVKGLVQIPCIERNAIAAMYKAGLDMNEKYKETGHGGLAVLYHWDEQ